MCCCVLKPSGLHNSGKQSRHVLLFWNFSTFWGFKVNSNAWQLLLLNTSAQIAFICLDSNDSHWSPLIPSTFPADHLCIYSIPIKGETSRHTITNSIHHWHTGGLNHKKWFPNDSRVKTHVLDNACCKNATSWIKVIVRPSQTENEQGGWDTAVYS